MGLPRGWLAGSGAAGQRETQAEGNTGRGKDGQRESFSYSENVRGRERPGSSAGWRRSRPAGRVIWAGGRAGRGLAGPVGPSGRRRVPPGGCGGSPRPALAGAAARGGAIGPGAARAPAHREPPPRAGRRRRGRGGRRGSAPGRRPRGAWGALLPAPARRGAAAVRGGRRREGARGGWGGAGRGAHEPAGSNGSCPGCRLEGAGGGGRPGLAGAVLIFTIRAGCRRVPGSLSVRPVPLLLSSDFSKLLSPRGSCTWRSPNSGNIFVVSLSVADLVVAVYPYPLILSAIFHNGWTMGNVHCQISGFLMGLSVIGSIFNITAIAINRYCYICHSLRYDKLFNLKNTCCYLCLTWILTVVAIVPNFFVGSLQYDPRIYSCTFAQTVSTSYTITVVVVHFIVPLSVVTFCYLRIWILVIQVKHRVRQDCKQKLRAADIRNFLTMFVVFVLFAVCWGPLNFIGLAVSINPSKVQPHIPEWLFVLSYFMAYFNSCLNAVIYGLLNQNFRKEYKRILLTLWTPRLLFIDVSKGGTEGMKSKHSPAITTNNNHAEIHL
ncbi:melatonin receptor type 1C [Manacus vitellinus]|uniref:melatonin receptor type 1C n=2 Tax=Passeriformes TaxID=9126 RepID=UPI00115D90CA|nr:melatonin receptor type 1C [Manacus vitellinus]